MSVVLLATTLGVLALAPAANAQQVLATGDFTLSPPHAYGQTVAWTAPESASAAKGHGYVVHAQTAGRSVRLKGSIVHHAYGLVLGPDRDGTTVALLSACRPRTVTRSGRRVSERDCDLFKYRFADGSTRSVTAANTAGYDESPLSIWRGRIAFSRIDRHGTDQVDDSKAMVLDEHGHGHATELPGQSAAAGIYGVALRGSSTLYMSSFLAINCGHPATNAQITKEFGEDYAPSKVTKISLRTPGQPTRTLERNCNDTDGARNVTAPQFTSTGQPVWAKYVETACDSSDPACVFLEAPHLRSFSKGKPVDIAVLDSSTVGYAIGSTDLYLLRRRSGTAPVYEIVTTNLASPTP